MGGYIYSLNGEDGSIAWSSYHAIGYSSPALGDVDGDGKLEVIFGTYNYKNDNYIYALNGEDGNEAWSYRIGAPRDIVRSSPALGDLDGDGMLEVVVGCDNTYVHALKPTPSGEEIKWQGLAGEDFLRKRALTATAGKDPDYIITQITNNDYRDSFPQIYNGLITWEGNDGYDNEIFLYDSSTGITTQITNDNDDNWGPQIDDGLVTWVGYDGPDWEIFLHDSGTDITTQITKNEEDDWSPQIHDGQLTWIGFDGDMEIFFYDGESTIQISHNSYIDSSPQIHNGQITWYEYDWHDEEIYFYDGESTIQITDNDYSDCGSQIYNGLITWVGYDGPDSDMEIFLYNSNTGITTQITNNDYQDSFPQIHNGYIAWEGKDGHDSEIFLYDGISTIQITDNNYQDYEPQIHDGLVTWWGWDGHDYEIFLYDSRTGISTQITDNEYDDRLPQIHEGQVTWVRWDGNDNEIFLATPSEDKTPPLITIEYLDGDHTDGNPGKWNVLAYDEESGINEDTIKILIDGEFVGNLFGDYDVPNALGEHTIYVEVENNDGYLGSESDSVTIIDDDITHPEISYIYTGDRTDGNPGEIIVTASDDSGLSIDPSGTYPVPNSLGTHNFIFSATDNDNDRVDDALTETITVSKTIYDDDITPPEIIIDYIGDGLDNNPGYFEWNIFDIDSGINHINITVIYESTEGLDDYTMYLEGTEMRSWDLPPNLGIYTIRIFARDNDDDRTLIVDSLTTELTRDQEIGDDDIDPPELSNLIIIPNIFEINITFGATDESGVGDISTFINGELIEPLTQIQYGNTYSLTFENQWLFEIGTFEVLIQVEDGDDDRPNDTLTSLITGTFENILYQMYEYVDWQLEELKNYIDENLYPCAARFLNRKLTIAQDHLNEAFSYIENGNITCGLFHDAIAKVMVQITEFKVELLNRFDRIDDEQAEYIIDSIHTIRNNIVLLMGASTGTEQGYNIASIEIDLLNLMDFIEDEIDWRDRWCLNYLFRSATRMLEIAIFKISMNLDINCTLTCVQWKLERAVCKVNRLLDRGKITQELADIILDKINQAYIDIEVVKTSI